MNTQTRTITPMIPPVTEQPSSKSLLLRPAGDINDIVLSWATYQELKSRLLDSNDWQEIGGRRCIKKSGWRKLQTAFGISDELVREERKEYKDYFVYEVTVKASANNGRYSFGVGSCSSSERRFAHPDHDSRSIAHTRAKNRAISDLIGGGEISAEELEVEHSRKEEISYVETLVGSEQEYRPEMQRGSQEMSTRQRNFLTSLINSKTADPEERDRKLAHMESIDKEEASQWIHDLCRM